MALLGMDLFVGFQYGIYDANEGSELERNGFALASVAWWRSILAHLLDGLAVYAKITRNFSLTFAFHHHCTSNLYISVSYTHLRAHETRHDLVCRLLLE